MSVLALALQRSKYKHLSDEEWRWMLQQAEGRERTADKLPTFAAMDDWWYPVRLSCEQCSSEQTAKYKASLIADGKQRMADLTAGYGVDTYFLSTHFHHADYVEQNAELCRIAAHNFKVQRDDVKGTKEITVHNTTAEAFLNTNQNPKTYDLLFLDPARRDSHGGKVFRLSDCTPNVVELLPTLLNHLAPEGQLMLKLSPMLDITQAITQLSSLDTPFVWDVHIVAVKNEVKETLLVGRKVKGGRKMDEGRITAIDLAAPEEAFIFTKAEESDSVSGLTGAAGLPSNSISGRYLYEPNAAILKAGAYKLVAERFGLYKLDVNTHLYTSDSFIASFPGRVWQIDAVNPAFPKGKETMQANVLTRNYPLTPDQLKKKLHLRDGGDTYLIGCRINGKPTLLVGARSK